MPLYRPVAAQNLMVGPSHNRLSQRLDLSLDLRLSTNDANGSIRIKTKEDQMAQSLTQMIQNLKSKFSRSGARSNDDELASLQNHVPDIDGSAQNSLSQNSSNQNGMPGEIDISLETRTGVKISTPPPPSVNEIFSTASPKGQTTGQTTGQSRGPTSAPAPSAITPLRPATASSEVSSATAASVSQLRPLPKAETTARHDVGGASHASQDDEYAENEFEAPKVRKVGMDLAIVAVAIMAIGGAAFFFFGDSFFSGKSHGQLTPVGKISKSHNDVRRKVDGGLSWGTVASADNVYEGDSVFTGDGSDAMILLDKGGQIAVDPKSLIVIRTKGNKLEVDLQYGSLEGHVEKNQPLLLKQGSEVKTLEGKDAQVRIVRAEKSHKTTIQVVSGELKIQDKVVLKNEVVELVKDLPPVVSKVQLSLVSPPTGKIMWLAMGKNVDFNWTSSKPDTQYVIELSKTTSFEHPIYNATMQGTSYQLAEESRPPGEFYWRVRPSKEGLPSLPARLTVYSDVPPKLVSPNDAYAFTLPSDAPTVEVPIVWEDTTGSTAYHLQVASDPEFKTVVVDEKPTAPHMKTKGLAQGHYSWRVMGTNPDRKDAPWSRTQTFSVDAAAAPLGAPLITQNDWHYEIPERALKGLLGPVTDDQGVQPHDLQPLAWPAVTEASGGYQVEESRNAEFKNASLYDVNEPSFVPDQVHPGVTFVRVRSKDASGHLSDASEPIKLTVTVEPPKMKAPKAQIAKFDSDQSARNSSVKHDFKLEWNNQVFADQYEVQWGSDPQFTRSKTFKVKTNKKQISVTHPMTYAARVRAIDKDGVPISGYSKVVVADLRKVVAAPFKALPKREVAAFKPPEPGGPAPVAVPLKVATQKPVPIAGLAMPRITAPILREPQPQSSLISLESSPTFVDFKWKPVREASFYVLEIAQDADFQSKIAEIKVQGASFVFQKPLPEGHVFWRVRYQKGRAQSEWSDVSDLNVIYQ